MPDPNDPSEILYACLIGKTISLQFELEAASSDPYF